MLRTNKQTDKHMDSNILPTPTDRIWWVTRINRQTARVSWLLLTL